MIKTLFFSAVLMIITSCAKDVAGGGEELPSIPEGYVRASLGLNISENEQMKTRATDAEEKAYDDANVWVLMFNSASRTDATPTTLVQAPVKAMKMGAKLYAMLRATAQPVTIYVITGLTATQNAYLGTHTNFTEGVTTYAAIRTGTGLQTSSVTAAGVQVGGTTPVNYIPMCTDRVYFPNGTITLTEVAASFKRIVAKIDVDASALSISHFALESIILINGAQKSFVLPQETIPTNHGGVIRYNEKNTVVSNKILSQLYLYENKGTGNPTKVIVKGRYKGGASSYYRIDLHKETLPGVYTPFDIERNKHYTIVISEIQNGGYLTPDEASNNTPSNAKYNVIVTDPSSHDIVSNGAYYLGVSNSEYIVCGDGGLNNLLAITLSHNAPSTVSSATLTLTGTGLSFGTVAGTTGTTTSRTLTTLNGTVQTIDVTINMAATFTTATTGSIVIQIGNLSKTIRIIRKTGLNAEDSQLTDFATQYVKGEVISGTSWVRLSLNSMASFNESPISITNPIGGIYVRYNSLLNMGIAGSAVLYLSRSSDEGRVKVALYSKG